jgi:predicted AlkP superfamily pyrophosphatase or phosphodiesterase
MSLSYPLASVARIIFIGALLLLPELRAQSSETVILVSFDGFRSDYVNKYNLPNFTAFAAAGTAAEGIVPCFPSLTFPNHYSIVTGMYPGNHGLVDNNFYDSALKVQYAIRNRTAVEDARFYGGTPLWALAKKSGIKTASFFWVGSEVKDTLKAPNKYFVYNSQVPFRTRIDSVVSWLKLPASRRPGFITLYFAEPDHTSHETGPNSEETHLMVLKMDSLLGYLMKGIADSKASVNTILVSDHGMSELTVADDTFTFLDELFDVKASWIKTVTSSTLVHLYVDKPSALDSLYLLLKGKEKNYKVYRKGDFPKEWHYQHYRVGDLVLVSAPYHYIRHSDREAFNRTTPQGKKFGVHGYDPAVVKDMHGLFMAQGPRIKKGKKIGFVRNLDVYPLIVRILGLKLPPIDGDPKALQSIYLKP